MRIHSDRLTTIDIKKVLNEAQASNRVPADVGFVVLSPHGSRSRKRAWEVQLGSSSPNTRLDGKERRYTHSGEHFAASYDEWGWFIAELFAVDTHAIVGPYTGSADFHAATDYRFAGGGQ